MQQEPDKDVTQILDDLRGGDSAAAEQLLPYVYDELRVIVGRILQSQRSQEKTLQPTILVHDVFMKLAQKTDIEWEGRVHFFAVAAKAIRDLLVDDIRRQQAAKRGDGWKRVTLSAIDGDQSYEEMIDVIDLEDALIRLGKVSPRQERIVELRFFGGRDFEFTSNPQKVTEMCNVCWNNGRI